MGSRAGGRRTGPKCIAIVGPFASGKTTLLEAILARTGAIPRQNPIGSGSTVGDHRAEANAHAMSVEATIATTEFMGESHHLHRLPRLRSNSPTRQSRCWPPATSPSSSPRPDEKKIPALQLVMRKLDELGCRASCSSTRSTSTVGGVRDMLKLLQPASSTPLLLRQIPLRKDGIVIGSIDLALERAYVYREHAESEVTEIPERREGARARSALLRCWKRWPITTIVLMEQLLEEIEPPRDEVFDDLAADLREGAVTPVLIGTAEKGNGVLRLLKAIRHDAPDIAATRERLGVCRRTARSSQVMKTIHTPHGGKLSVARILSGTIADGDGAVPSRTAIGARSPASTSCSAREPDQVRVRQARRHRRAGQARRRSRPGDTLLGREGGIAAACRSRAAATGLRLRAAAEGAQGRGQDVGSAPAAGRGRPSLTLEHNQDTGETILSGHGEMHLRVVRRAAGGQVTRSRIDSRSAVDPLPRDDPQVCHASAAATRSSRAATASSATWCSRSSRCRAAAASSSPTRSPAASCRSSISSRSRPACATI